MSEPDIGHHVQRMLFDALEALKGGDGTAWADMFAQDGVMEFPYAPPGYPPRLVGKSAIAAYMKTYSEHLRIEKITPGTIYPSGDTTIAEFGLERTAVPTGNRFTMNYVAIIRTANGKVTLYRDYWNPLVGLQAMGGADALFALGR